MNSTPPIHNPAIQRINKAYIQIPSSPLSLSNYRVLGTPTHVAASSMLKENTPLRPFQMAMVQHAPLSTTSKRKVLDREPSSLIFDGASPSAKKLKLSTTVANNTQPKLHINQVMSADNACADFPGGFAYCHQCNKKRDISAIIRCTVVEKYRTVRSNDVKERLCINKYCKSCLMNRYDQDIEVLKSQAHGTNSAVSNFKCPKCMGVCNCPRCRKSKGLEPTGVMPKKPQDPAAPKPAKKLKVEVVIDLKPTQVAKPKPIRKALPILTWNPVSTRLTQSEVNERIFIREFALRFSDLLDPVIAKVHLEELEFVIGRPRKSEEEDTMVGWVGEMCIKALIMGLLGLLVKDHDSNISQMIKASVKDLRSSGANLNKIWAALASLRENVSNASASRRSATSSLSDAETPLTFPDPLSHPGAENARSLRSVRHYSQSSVNVTHPAQMIPVIVSLIHSVLETDIIREDINQSVKDCRDFARDAKEATKMENERWEQVRSGMEKAANNKAQKDEDKIKRKVHKDQISNIDNSLKIISRNFLPRFMALGTDDDGRTYYALSPSAAEREAAFEYLELASSERPTKPKKKGRTVPSEDRQELRDWPWFLAVWGKRPVSSLEDQMANVASKMDVDSSEQLDSNEDSMDEEKWWGFCEPEDIVKVAEWISIKSDLEDCTHASKAQSGSSLPKPAKEKTLPSRVERLNSLVTELKDYATLLQWRIREDKCNLASRVPASCQVNVNQVQSDTKGKSKLSTGAVSVNSVDSLC